MYGGNVCRNQIKSQYKGSFTKGSAIQPLLFGQTQPDALQMESQCSFSRKWCCTFHCPGAAVLRGAVPSRSIGDEALRREGRCIKASLVHTSAAGDKEVKCEVPRCDSTPSFIWWRLISAPRPYNFIKKKYYFRQSLFVVTIRYLGPWWPSFLVSITYLGSVYLNLLDQRRIVTLHSEQDYSLYFTQTWFYLAFLHKICIHTRALRLQRNYDA